MLTSVWRHKSRYLKPRWRDLDTVFARWTRLTFISPPGWFSSLSSCLSSSKSIRSKRAKPRLVRGSTNSATNPKRHRIGYETLSKFVCFTRRKQRQCLRFAATYSYWFLFAVLLDLTIYGVLDLKGNHEKKFKLLHNFLISHFSLRRTEKSKAERRRFSSHAGQTFGPGGAQKMPTAASHTATQGTEACVGSIILGVSGDTSTRSEGGPCWPWSSFVIGVCRCHLTVMCFFFCDLVVGLLSTGLGQVAVFSLPPTPRTYFSVLPLEHWDPNFAALHPSYDFFEMFTLSFIYVHTV